MKKPNDISEEDFDIACNRLIEKGLMEKVMVDGKESYKLTSVGKEVGKQMMDNTTPLNKRN
jgi:predicted transcriptional regulator with HTH domain